MIKLDTGIELEDFDPLNENARPIPSPKNILHNTLANDGMGSSGILGSSSELPAVSPLSFNNPLYQFYQPPNLHRTAAVAEIPSSHQFLHTPGAGDEVELLRKYGLDRFSIANDSRSPDHDTTRADRTNGGTNGKRTNWTTFE